MLNLGCFHRLGMLIILFRYSQVGNALFLLFYDHFNFFLLSDYWGIRVF